MEINIFLEVLRSVNFLFGWWPFSVGVDYFSLIVFGDSWCFSKIVMVVQSVGFGLGVVL